MKKMLLTSDGISYRKIMKEAKKLLIKPSDEIKVLIMYALMKKKNLKYLIKIRKQLKNLGIKKKNIFYVNISNNIKPPKQDFDIIYSCGGNTFYILDRLRKTGFYKFIKNFVNKGGFYIGVSAGSIIVHKTIELAGYGSEGDINEINLKNLDGLNLINIGIFPHYHIALKKEINEFRKNVNYPVKELKDGQALLILGNKVRKI